MIKKLPPKTNTVIRADLIKSIQKALGLPNAEAAAIFETMIEEIFKGVKEEKIVKLPSFGSFFLRKKAARIGRNPKTLQQILIPQRQVMLFRPSSFLRKRVS